MLNKIPDLCTQLKSLVQKGHYQQALALFHHYYKHHSLLPHETLTHILPSLIKSSSSSNHHLLSLQALHSLSLKTSAISDLFVSNSLISAYFKHPNAINSAHKLFDEMPQRDTVSWNSIIMGFIQNEMFGHALQFFAKMCTVASEAASISASIKPEVIASILSVCSKTGRLRQGKEIHGLLLQIVGMEESSMILVETALVDLYVKCGELVAAFRVFDRIKGVKNEVTWTAMINGCTANGAYEMAIDCLKRMVLVVRPNRVTLLSVMPACAELGLVKQGKEIHGFGLRHGFDKEPQFLAGLISMYTSLLKGGGASSPPSKIAGIILDMSNERDVVMWTAVITSFARDGRLNQALKYLNRMRSEGIEPNNVTLLALISCCANQVSVSNGQGIHCHAMKTNLYTHPHLVNALIDMYAKCGLVKDSFRAFSDLPNKDSVSWSSLINSYGINGDGHRALQAFHEMKEKGIEVDGIALLSALSACNHSGLVEQAETIFNEAAAGVLAANKRNTNMLLSIEHYACMIDLFGKAGMIEEAYEVTKLMPEQSAKIWSSLVSRCKDYGMLDLAERLIKKQNWAVEVEGFENAPGIYAASGMINAERGEWANVEEIRRLMRVEGLKKRRGFSRVEVCNG